MATPLLDNRQLGPDTARANLLTNGGFEVWQRGAGPFSTPGTYSADRWYTQLSGTDTLSIQKQTTSNDALGNACLWAHFTLGTGAGASSLLQILKFSEIGAVGNRTFSLSMRVWASVPNAVRLALYDDAGGGVINFSSYHPGNSSYQTLTVTMTLPTGGTGLWSMVYFSATSDFYLDNAMLVVGSQPADYAPLHPAEDLARCLRYYQRIQGAQADSGVAMGMASSATACYFICHLPARMAVAPSFTVSAPSDWAAWSAATVKNQFTSGPVIYTNTASLDRFLLSGQAGGLVAGNATLLAAYGATSTMSFEANP